MDKSGIVGSMGYDDNVKRKSIENKSKNHRKSSIPYADRTPAVRYISAIEKRKSSLAGPHDPSKRDPNRPILKKQVSTLHDGNENASITDSADANDELENCRCKTELIMELMTKAERLARGSMDILSFPPAGNVAEVLSRFHGCMTICVCTIHAFSTSKEYSEYKNKGSEQLSKIMNNSVELHKEAEKLSSTSNKFLTKVKQRISEWEAILKKNSEFYQVESKKLDYPIYSRKSMPESATVFEHFVDEENRYPVEGFCGMSRTPSDGVIHLHCEDYESTKLCDDLDFVKCEADKQIGIISIITSHGKDLVECSNNCLNNGLISLQRQEIDNAYTWVQTRLSKINYEGNYDPLCALELKNVCAEVAARKSELLNVAEQISSHVKWVVNFTGTFLRFTKQSLYGAGLLSCCKSSCTQDKLLQIIGPVATVNLQIFLPLSDTIAENVFQLQRLQSSKVTTEA
ncbi:unnamed protein product [Orchesella dallaii]|uniref:Uncharacterized protein n=1 Tax=Orchesella dallaii TaxID=48710 RepID=A0ABP1QQZ9_9HEXA